MSHQARTAALAALLLVAGCTDLPSVSAGFRPGGGGGRTGGASTVSDVVVANAGSDQVVSPGATVFLDGRASYTATGAAVGYLWSQVRGPQVTLSDPGAARPRFTAPFSPGALTFLLTASAGGVHGTDVVQVLVRTGTADRAPFAVAGPDLAVAPGDTVHLDGSASTDPDGDPLSYVWRGADGARFATGPTATLTAPTTSGYLPVRLEVSDGVLTARDDVLILVGIAPKGEKAPVATATAPTSVNPGATVTLGGTAQDPNGDTVSLAWRQIAGAPVALTGRGAAAIFTAPRTVGFLAFELLSTDGTLDGAPVPAGMRVTAGPGNRAPIARAGTDQTVAPGATVTLDGSASADPDGQALTYRWTQLGGPQVTLSAPTHRVTRFTAPSTPAPLTFALVVSDGTVDSVPSLVQVVVASP